MTRLLVCLLLLATSACGQEGYDGPRFHSTEDGVSFAKLTGWNVTRERATVVLSNPKRAATIAIRTIPRDGWSEPRDSESVFPAVATVLGSLPQARVSEPKDVAAADYPAVEYDVDFRPSRAGKLYQRRHIALLADSHVIHVFIVAPAGQLEYSRAAFETIVKTIREEG